MDEEANINKTEKVKEFSVTYVARLGLYCRVFLYYKHLTDQIMLYTKRNT